MKPLIRIGVLLADAGTRAALRIVVGSRERQALMAEVGADMAARLERMREMERRGELAAISREGTALH